MKLKTIISLFACSCFFGKSEAQQIFSITQYMEHNFLYNPAAAGAGDHPSIGASYKKMWSGIDGGPQTTILFGDKYFSKKKIGVGIVLYDDKTGPTSREGGEINLSYSIPLKGEKRLMFGLGGQFLQCCPLNFTALNEVLYVVAGDGPGEAIFKNGCCNFVIPTDLSDSHVFS